MQAKYYIIYKTGTGSIKPELEGGFKSAGFYTYRKRFFGLYK